MSDRIIIFYIKKCKNKKNELLFEIIHENMKEIMKKKYKIEFQSYNKNELKNYDDDDLPFMMIDGNVIKGINNIKTFINNNFKTINYDFTNNFGNMGRRMDYNNILDNKNQILLKQRNEYINNMKKNNDNAKLLLNDDYDKNKKNNKQYSYEKRKPNVALPSNYKKKFKISGKKSSYQAALEKSGTNKKIDVTKPSKMNNMLERFMDNIQETPMN